MPVLFPKSIISNAGLRILQHRRKAFAHESAPVFGPRKIHESPRNIHGTHQIRIHRAGLDLGGPANNPWRAHAAVIQSRLIPWHRSTIVADKHHQRIVIDLLPLQLGQHLANKSIQPANLIVVQRVITTHFRSIRHIGRQGYVLRFRGVL